MNTHTHLKKEMATHSRTPAWKIPWTPESGGLQSMGSQRVGNNLPIKPAPHTHIHTHTHTSKPLFCVAEINNIANQPYFNKVKKNTCLSMYVDLGKLL